MFEYLDVIVFSLARFYQKNPYNFWIMPFIIALFIEVVKLIKGKRS